jgi:hypothetical protein
VQATACGLFFIGMYSGFPNPFGASAKTQGKKSLAFLPMDIKLSARFLLITSLTVLLQVRIYQ